jgi:hypothetical protein
VLALFFGEIAFFLHFNIDLDGLKASFSTFVPKLFCVLLKVTVLHDLYASNKVPSPNFKLFKAFVIDFAKHLLALGL